MGRLEITEKKNKKENTQEDVDIDSHDDHHEEEETGEDTGHNEGKEIGRSKRKFEIYQEEKMEVSSFFSLSLDIFSQENHRNVAEVDCFY